MPDLAPVALFVTASAMLAASAAAFTLAEVPGAAGLVWLGLRLFLAAPFTRRPAV